MKTSFKKLLNRNLMVFSDFEIENYTENYLMKMITQNNIAGLLPTQIQYINAAPTLNYDITSRRSLSSYMEGKKLTSDFLSSLFLAVYTICVELERYLLDGCYLMLSPEHIFLDFDSAKFYFCYCPIPEDSANYSLLEKIKELTDLIITKLDYEDLKGVAFAYTLQKKAADGTLTLKDLTADFSAPETKPQPVVEESPQEIEPENVPSLPTELFSIIEKSIYAVSALIGIIGIGLFLTGKISAVLLCLILVAAICISTFCAPYFKRKFSLSSYIDEHKIPADDIEGIPKKSVSTPEPVCCETVLINYTPAGSIPKLIYSGVSACDEQDAVISLEKFPYTIGKMRDCSDHLLNAPTISRLHAKFDFDGSSYFLEDLNSSNGTFLNGTAIAPHTRYALKDGDTVMLANMAFTFTL